MTLFSQERFPKVDTITIRIHTMLTVFNQTWQVLQGQQGTQAHGNPCPNRTARSMLLARNKGFGNPRIDLRDGRIEDATVMFYDVLSDVTASMGPIEMIILFFHGFKQATAWNLIFWITVILLYILVWCALPCTFVDVFCMFQTCSFDDIQPVFQIRIRYLLDKHGILYLTAEYYTPVI